MHYETGAGITLDFKHEDRDESPFLVVRNVPGIPGVHIYHAASFLTAAAENRSFTIGVDWNDQEPFVIHMEDVRAIAAMVRSDSDRKRGYFEMKWVALNQNDPF